MEHQEIKSLLRQRYPFLLVDRVLEVGDTHVTGVKNITASDTGLQGHFDDEPIYPGVLLVEAMSQVGGILLALKGNVARRGYLAKIDKVRFVKFLQPGDQVVMRAERVHEMGSLARVRIAAHIMGTPVADAEITYVLRDAPHRREEN